MCLRRTINTCSDYENPHGKARRVAKTPFETSGFANADALAARVFKMVNENVRNPVSSKPLGYKLVPQPCQLLLAGADLVLRKRARFAEHHIWETKYRHGNLCAAGKWTNQSLREINGLHDYAARAENVRGEDVVLWHTFEITHNPWLEDFPVMPVEITTISLMPADFFTKNPALDVPRSRQATNKIVLYEASLGRDGECCVADEKSKL